MSRPEERTDLEVTLALRTRAPVEPDAIEDPLTPLQQRISRLARRASGNLAIPDGMWPDVLAVVVSGLPELAAADAALKREAELLPRLAVLDALHKPVRWHAESDVVVCSCGSGAFDACQTRQILDGKLPEVTA